jgi:dUTP pyrophosphatase
MYASGAFVADHVEPVSEAQVQPNGVDLTVEAVLEQREPGRITQDGKTIGDRQPIQPDTGGDTDTFYLPPGGYVLQYAETISIPGDLVGFVYPRSSLMRNSCMLNTAVWDAGYTGKGEGLLQVHHDVELERGARVAQLVLADAHHEGSYDGSYQNERVDERRESSG